MVTIVDTATGIPQKLGRRDVASTRRGKWQVSRSSLISYSAVVSLVVANTAVFYTLPIAFSSRFPYRLESLGTAWGPLVFTGQWWRVLTCFFVHFQLSHLFFNMLALWILGTRMERELGRWFFLLFYLVCGLVVALSVLALRPDVASYGASGAVLGLAGGVIAFYSGRLQGMSWGSRSKFVVLVLFVAALAWRELSMGYLYLPHTTGFLAGGFLGLFLAYVARTELARLSTFVGLIPLLVGAAILVQRYHR